MKYRTIESSREVRLWITQVIVPGVMAGLTILSIPGVKEAIGETVCNARNAVKNKVKR